MNESHRFRPQRIRRTSGSRAHSLRLRSAVPLLFAPSVASEQEWLKDRRYQEARAFARATWRSIRAYGGEIGYDSNWFLRSSKTNTRFVNGAPQTPLRPQARSGSLRRSRSARSRSSASRAHLHRRPSRSVAGSPATYREFLPAPELRDQRNVSGNAFARLDINQGGRSASACRHLSAPDPAVGRRRPKLVVQPQRRHGGRRSRRHPGGGRSPPRRLPVLRFAPSKSRTAPVRLSTHELASEAVAFRRKALFDSRRAHP